MPSYRHTQFGTLTVAALGGMLAYIALLSMRIGLHPIVAVVGVVLLVCLVLFHSLTVEVSNETLRLRFGPGPIRRTFAIADVASARAVRNPWYYGWGLRFYGRGWLYNVSGLDAVEITLRDGRAARIGTDEPDALCSAILDAVERRGGA
jgi:hypothetical protein